MAKRKKSKIVYHGTFSDAPPEDWLQDTFHAGTLRAVEDRAYDQLTGGEVEEPAIQRVYAYKISGSAPMSRRTWADPDIELSVHKYEGAPPAVPEHKTNRIYPYQNAREDYGSTSYVIPSEFVGRQVKNLGVQFQGFYGNDEQEKSLMNAITTMSGGKAK